jgi:tRNA(His) 5'-end guanylyltransferase
MDWMERGIHVQRYPTQKNHNAQKQEKEKQRIMNKEMKISWVDMKHESPEGLA